MAIHQLVEAGDAITADFWQFFTAAPKVAIVIEKNKPQWEWEADSTLSTKEIMDRYGELVTANGDEAVLEALEMAEARENGDFESITRFVIKTAAWSLFLGPKFPMIGSRFVLAVDLSVQSPDPKDFDLKAADGVDIKLDTRYTYRVIDPVKFASRLRDNSRDQWIIAVEILNELLRGHLNELTSTPSYDATTLSRFEKDQLRKMSEDVMTDVNKFVRRFGLELLDFSIEQITADPKVSEGLADQRAAEVAIKTAEHRAVAAEHEATALRLRREAIKDATPAEAMILTADKQGAQVLNLLAAASQAFGRTGDKRPRRERRDSAREEEAELNGDNDDDTK